MRRREASLLAIVETIAASGASAWLAWSHHSIDHLVIAGALAPLLLVRSEIGTRYTLFALDKWYQWAEKHLGVLLLPPVLPLAKTYFSLRAVCRWPLNGLGSIPNNFFENVFVFDMAVSPSLVPVASGFERHRIPSYLLQQNIMQIYSTIGDAFVELRLELLYILKIIAALIIYSPVIAVSLSFRFAVKSTALLWLPLLWIIRQTRSDAAGINILRLYVEDAQTKLVLLYSMFVSGGFVLKLWVYLAASEAALAQLAQLGPLGTLLARLVAPLAVPLWQITSAFNAALSFMYYLRARRQILAASLGVSILQEQIQREYAVYQAVRTTLSLYAIACTFYIAITTALERDWPPIRIVLFPWSG